MPSMQAVTTDPGNLFLEQYGPGVNPPSGTVITAAMQGSRTLLVEVQALTASSVIGAAKRKVSGVSSDRVGMIIAVLEKRADLRLAADDVFVNVAGGLEIDEPAADLGVVASIASSFKNAPVDEQTAVFGEVGLTGEVRGAMQAQARAREAQALGFKKIIMPASNTSGLERLLGVRTVGVRSVEEALDELF